MTNRHRNLQRHGVPTVNSMLLACILILLSPAVSLGQLLGTEAPPLGISSLEYTYRWGDSPLNEVDVPIWLGEPLSSEWLPIKRYWDAHATQQGERVLWLRIELPALDWPQPALLVAPVSQSLDVYVGYRLLYRYHHGRYSQATWHNIPLDAAYQGESLFLRIGAHRHKGSNLKGVWLGSQTSLLRKLIHLGYAQFVLGVVFAFLGLLSILLRLRYCRKRPPEFRMLRAFAMFAVFVGLHQCAESPMSQLFITSPIARYYLSSMTFLLFPIGLYTLCEQLFGAGYRSIIRRVWQFHLFYGLVLLCLDMTKVLRFHDMVSLSYGVLALGLLLIIPVIFRAASKGHREAKVFGVGFAAMSLGGVHDVLIALWMLPRWSGLFPWGVLLFMLCLWYILTRRFSELEVELENHSQELETANAQLADYSNTLEQRVKERTQEIHLKNQDLERTLMQLQETQSQLITQEKMASLGNLVAGVAHEMNNPVGAIRSSADIGERGLDKLEEQLGTVRTVEELHTNRRLPQLFELLRTNQQTIALASDRVSQVIQSLKLFARLDEAVMQEADIHASIETTLTLVQHELKSKANVVCDYGDVPQIMCYPSELNQVFISLIRNAAQAIDQRGTITISTHAHPTEVKVLISDTGRGIPADQLGRIFDPGFTTRGAGVGTGLGLSITYAIIQKHRGDIQVRSTVGEGTEVSVVLPIGK